MTRPILRIRKTLSGLLSCLLALQAVPAAAVQIGVRTAAQSRGTTVSPVALQIGGPSAAGFASGLKQAPSFGSVLPSFSAPRVTAQAGTRDAAAITAVPLQPASGPVRALPAAISAAAQRVATHADAATPMQAAPETTLRAVAPLAARRLKANSAKPDGGALASSIWSHALARGFALKGRQQPVELPASGKALATLLSRGKDLRPENTAAKDAPPQAEETGRAPRLLNKTTLGFFLSLAAAELWLEAGAVILPQLARSISGAFFPLALAGSVSVAALAIGGLAGGPLVDRFGVRKVYVGGLVLRAAAAGALFAFYSQNLLTLPLLMGLLGVDYLIAGANRISESTLPTVLYGSKFAPLNRFGAWTVRVIEIAGLLGPVAVGAIVLLHGFAPALGVFAAVLSLGALLAAFLLRPGKAPVREARAGGIAKAWAALRRDPMIRKAAIGMAIPLAVTLAIYLLVGHAFGAYVAGSPEAASAVVAWLTGLFCAGGLAGSMISSVLTDRLEARLNARGRSEAQKREAYVRSTRGWIMAAGISLLGLWAFISPLPVLGVLPAYLAVIPLGAAMAGAAIQSESLIKSVTAPQILGSLIGIIRTAALTLTAALFLPLGWAFDTLSTAAAVPAPAAFAVLGVAATAAAASAVIAAARFKPTAPPAAFRLSDLAAYTSAKRAAAITREIHEIGSSVGWSVWFKDIDDYLSRDHENILLALDPDGHLAGFLILGDRYQNDKTNEIIRLPVPSYIAYVAARREPKISGVGKALTMAAFHRARTLGSDELHLHVRKGDPAVGFYEALSKTIPITRVVEDTDYVIDEVWLKMTFDLTGLAQLNRPKAAQLAAR